MKLITFAVPCYNSAAYMEHCIETLLTGGDDVEIILVNDGSKDETGAIADRYAAQYPEIIRAVHQPNGGHGEGVNQGLRHATGLYYKVVDSDDWLDEGALAQLIRKVKENLAKDELLDLYIFNYVYEHVAEGKSFPMKYTNVFPVNQKITWDAMKSFGISQYLLMHAVMYRTEVLRACGLELPKHTFYVDNLFVYKPFPLVRSVYYMDLDLYRYYIGRADQSVNEKVMVGRVDQQVRITKIMRDYYTLDELKKCNKKLAGYMSSYLAMMMTISSIFLILTKDPKRYKERTELWKELKQVDPAMYRRIRYGNFLGFGTSIPGAVGRWIAIAGYRAAQKLYRFNS